MHGLRVLAVDHSKNGLQILKSYLESFTLDVATADNTEDALDMVRKGNEAKKPFGLVVIDCKLPEMDGMDVARKLRDSLF